jgi:hypothetical protein
MRIMTALCACRFVAQIQALVSVSRKTLPYFADAKPIPLACESFAQALRAKYGMLSLSSFAAPTVLGSVRSEKQGRTRRSAAICASATLSQRRSCCNLKQYEDGGSVSKFLTRGSTLARFKKRDTHRPTATAAPKVRIQEGWNGRASRRGSTMH